MNEIEKNVCQNNNTTTAKLLPIENSFSVKVIVNTLKKSR